MYQSLRNNDPGKKHLFQRQRLWSNLTGIQTFHSRLTSSQHMQYAEDEAAGPKSASEKAVRSFANSISQISWSPLFPCITSLSQSNLIRLPTFRGREQERNRPFTRPIFPMWRKMVLGTRLATEYCGGIQSSC